VPDYNEAMVWLKLAKRDYAVALHLSETLDPKPIEVICFHSQQAVEKALKAVLAYNEAKIPKIHDITALHALCKAYTNKLLLQESAEATLTDFAVAARYVEDRSDYTEDTGQFALKQAQRVLGEVEQIFEAKA